jgi:hypothetical protein
MFKLLQSAFLSFKLLFQVHCIIKKIQKFSASLQAGQPRLGRPAALVICLASVQLQGKKARQGLKSKEKTIMNVHVQAI